MTEDKDARIAELERTIEQIEDRAATAYEMLESRLTKKLAEQQAKFRKHAEAYGQAWAACYVKDYANLKAASTESAFRGLASITDTLRCGLKDSSEELNNLLTKAKEEGRREAVPEGWQVVPKTPTIVMQERLAALMDYPAIVRGYKAMLTSAPNP